ncbi:unnamed protein product [Anisakis simplex]|uniref:Complex1_LYR_dom domain-containing protein n=1 Tax=Anisakis simplex TaxID=6269 RepID=A0A0M3JW55_ANISI|nr:unnamed protein product [Anisakis simplex]
MSAGANKSINLYRQILRLARNWKALNPEHTAAEREAIRKEAREQFRAHAKETDPKTIADLHREAEARIVSAEHYGIPYKRPEYLPPNTSYGRMLNSKEDSLEGEIYRNLNLNEFPYALNSFDQSPLSFTAVRLLRSIVHSLDLEVNNFVRQYFACVSISKDSLAEVIRYCEDALEGKRLIQNVLASEIWIRFPEKRNSHSKILKELVSSVCIIVEFHSDSTKFLLFFSFYLSIVESASLMSSEVCDGLYEAVTRSMDTSADYGHRLYLSGSGKRFIVLKEKNEQLSLGTTGLSCWQASCDLAHYLLGVGSSYLQGRNVLELGAGCGFCGIALAASAMPRSVTLTDCNAHVLTLLRQNVENNFSEESKQQVKINVCHFDWTSSKASDLPTRPDLIVASGKNFGIAESNGLKVDEKFIFSNGAFRFNDGRRIIEPSLFPFVSTINCPTTFHWISSK